MRILEIWNAVFVRRQSLQGFVHHRRGDGSDMDLEYGQEETGEDGDMVNLCIANEQLENIRGNCLPHPLLGWTLQFIGLSCELEVMVRTSSRHSVPIYFKTLLT